MACSPLIQIWLALFRIDLQGLKRRTPWRPLGPEIARLGKPDPDNLERARGNIGTGQTVSSQFSCLSGLPPSLDVRKTKYIVPDTQPVK